jgi:hypothetical protein
MNVRTFYYKGEKESACMPKVSSDVRKQVTAIPKKVKRGKGNGKKTDQADFLTAFHSGKISYR